MCFCEKLMQSMKKGLDEKLFPLNRILLPCLIFKCFFSRNHSGFFPRIFVLEMADGVFFLFSLDYGNAILLQ